MSVFGFCKNKCKHDVYTVQETNDLLAGKASTNHDHTGLYYNANTEHGANTVLACPNGSNGTATFRKLVANDLPTHTHTDYKLKGDFAIITGTIIMPEQDSETLSGVATVDLPNGFTESNSVIISVMSKVSGTNRHYATATAGDNSVSQMFGNNVLFAYFTNEKIGITSYKVSTVQSRNDVSFKIVLMKV